MVAAALQLVAIATIAAQQFQCGTAVKKMARRCSSPFRRGRSAEDRSGPPTAEGMPPEHPNLIHDSDEQDGLPCTFQQCLCSSNPCTPLIGTFDCVGEATPVPYDGERLVSLYTGLVRVGRPENCFAGGGGGGMAWVPGEGGGGGAFQKWASVTGPLFCVRTDVAAKGAGTQILAGKNFFHEKMFPHICVVKMISATRGSF